jgi:ParB family chromosome partitioning protein
VNVEVTPVEVRLIPHVLIDVLNPRERNNAIFAEIVENIRAIGLKKPVTVTERRQPDGSTRYLLVCGEGRLKAFRSLGVPEIAALVISVTDETALIMSLVENIARRNYKTIELFHGIEELRKFGYDRKTIALKTGLSVDYTGGILSLLERGEERLVCAVQQGKIPLNVAIAIVGGETDDQSIQGALQDAYESGKLKGRQLLNARQLIQRRKQLGRTFARGQSGPTSVTGSSLIKTYQREVARQKNMIMKSNMVQQKLAFVTGALRELLADEDFTNLLRAENLDSLPKYLAERVWPHGRAA